MATADGKTGASDLGERLAAEKKAYAVVAPRFTRAVTAVFSAVAVSDHLQLTYAERQKAAE